MTASRPASSDQQTDAAPTFQDRLKRSLPYFLIVCVGLYLLHLTRGFDYDQAAGSIGPHAWPRLVLFLMVGCCAFEILRLALFWNGDRRSGQADDDVVPDLTEDDAGFDNLAQASAALGAIIAYLLTLPYLGFFAATVTFIWSFAVIAGYPRLFTVTVVALSLTLIFMFLFMKVIYVSLPIGMGPFAQLSLWMMKLLGVT